MKKYILNRLRELGYTLTLLTQFEFVFDNDLYDKVISCKFNEWDKVIEILKKEHKTNKFIGVFGYDEISIPIVDEISKSLNLKIISKFSGESYRFKDKMRIAWESSGVSIPKYKILHKKEEYKYLNEFSFPMVLKPVSYLGSLGVIKVNSYSELKDKVNLAFNAELSFEVGKNSYNLKDLYSLESSVLAEDYIEGDEYSAEGYLIDGRYELIGFTKKFTTKDDFFDELAHIFPYKFKQEEEIVEEIRKAHVSLGIQNAFTHTEFKIINNKVCFMELGARLSGDFIPKLIENSFEIDAIDYAIKCRTGESIENIKYVKNKIKNKYTAIYFISAPIESYGKKFNGIAINDMLKDKIIEIEEYYTVGDVIEAAKYSGKERVGHIILEDSDYKDIKAKLILLYKNIKVEYY